MKSSAGGRTVSSPKIILAVLMIRSSRMLISSVRLFLHEMTNNIFCENNKKKKNVGSVLLHSHYIQKLVIESVAVNIGEKLEEICFSNCVGPYLQCEVKQSVHLLFLRFGRLKNEINLVMDRNALSLHRNKQSHK